MKTLVLYYSYSGKTRTKAREIAERENAELAEIKDEKRPGKIKVFTIGIISAIRGKAWSIEPIAVDLESYERLILLSPVWASNFPPAVNNRPLRKLSVDS